MSLRENKIITVQQGQENQSKEENIYLENTFFCDCYAQAKECLWEILKYSELKDIPSDELSRYSDVELNRLLLSKNLTNIITFCADRGGGKTTAMVSFAKSLEKVEEVDSYQDSLVRKFWKSKDNSKVNVLDYRFQVINSIDPTTMEDHDSILQMVLSRMFSLFQTLCEKQNNSSAFSYQKMESDQNEIFELFQRCYHNLEVHTAECSQKEVMDDELEQMAELGDSTNLKASLYRLICKYLDFPRGQNKRYLVIQIDDTDLNVKKAFPILEEIRKYLLLPRVIVLLAANMSQLESTVEQYFFRQYEVSLKYPGSMVGIEQCHLIAEQYLEKLIPGFRRIYLPDLSKAIHKGFKELQVDYREPFNKYRDEVGEALLETGNEWSYQRQLLYFLHKKTGLMYYAPQAYLHNFLPSSMRELTHFLSYFGDMKDVNVGYQDVIHVLNTYTGRDMSDELHSELQTWQLNLERLEHYLLYPWSSMNLRNDGAYYLRELASQPQESKNRYILGMLPSYYASERIGMDRVRNVSLQNAGEYQKQFREECEKNGVYINETLFHEQEQNEKQPYASYADVLTALRILTDLPGGNRQYKFAYAIRFYYTIYLHQMMLKKCVDNEQVNPADFMEDVLMRSGEPGSRNTYPAFWYFRLDAKDVIQNFSNGMTQPDIAFLSAYLRKEEKGEYNYKTELIDYKKEKEDYFSGTWIFNPFYYLLYHLDNLFRGSSNKQMDGTICTKTEIAMIVLLNWDIQYYLLHEYKNKPISKDEPLNNLMHELFEINTFQGCLKEVQRQNAPKDNQEKYTNFVKSFLFKIDEEKMFDEGILPNGMDRIELSSDPQFYFQHRYNDFVKELKELKHFLEKNPDKKETTWDSYKIESEKEFVPAEHSPSPEQGNVLQNSPPGESGTTIPVENLARDAKILLIVIKRYPAYFSQVSEEVRDKIIKLHLGSSKLEAILKVFEELKEEIDKEKSANSNEADTCKEDIIDTSLQKEFEEKLRNSLIEKMVKEIVQIAYKNASKNNLSLEQKRKFVNDIMAEMIEKLYQASEKNE